MIRRSTWIVLVVFVLLLGGAWYWQQSDKQTAAETTPTPAPGTEFLFDFDQGDVSGLKIVANNGESVAMERSGKGTWTLSEPQAGPADESLAADAISNLATLRVLTTLEEPPSLETLGLAAPVYSLTITLQDGQQKTMLIGIATPTNSGYYAQVDGGKVQVVNKFAMDSVVGIVENPPLLVTPTPMETQSLPAGTPGTPASDTTPQP